MAPSDNRFMTDSDSDDMPPLASVSSSSESDEESEDESKRDQDGIPGQGIFQLQVPDRGVGRNERQEMMTSNYLPAGMCQTIFNFSTQLTPKIFMLVLGPPSAMAITQLPMLFRPPMPMPEGTYCPPPSLSNGGTNELPCECLPHVYLTCVNMPFESPSLTELKVEPNKPHTVIPSEIMMSGKP